ncbi:Glycosyltransferase involved in cell wall bisynthesis [Microbacterium sp. cf046]|uniref:glycosyltransferase family 4 protein n=1 Tax=Microbacterium sp. cf046 TaxID=1761803 RepID=UPI0008E7DE1A|nr:glycosyltransferase family 4 protein [Microbacterium sp. cf046]SFR90845.1 Glycosyltransferase involved in cell wall bisynthesis [Microbacterium sp. cf046]
MTGSGESRRRLIHVITPGDHFSPLTGSATVSVVHGLSVARAPGSPRPAVLVAAGTYADRYDSADVLEYRQRPTHRVDRYVDAVRSRWGLSRSRARDRYRAALIDQDSWDPAFVIGHNAVQLVPVVDAARHTPVLYAHNDLLRSYSRREAGATLDPAAAIIAVSSYLAERLQSSLPPALRGRVEVVANGVDVAAFDAPPRPSGRPLHVAFLGRMVPDKGADVLVDALTRLNRPDIHTKVIGSEGFDPRSAPSTFERSLRQASAPLGSRIEFLPFQPRAEVVRLLADADVVVVPSRWPEPFALTVLEGMASGAAVIASDIGGIPEACGGAGVLVPAGDTDALALALAALTDDEDALRALQASSRERARSRDWSVVARELDAALARHA